jgi:hypothetical protein
VGRFRTDVWPYPWQTIAVYQDLVQSAMCCSAACLCPSNLLKLWLVQPAFTTILLYLPLSKWAFPLIDEWLGHEVFASGPSEVHWTVQHRISYRIDQQTPVQLKPISHLIIHCLIENLQGISVDLERLASVVRHRKPNTGLVSLWPNLVTSPGKGSGKCGCWSIMIGCCYGSDLILRVHQVRPTPLCENYHHLSLTNLLGILCRVARGGLFLLWK